MVPPIDPRRAGFVKIVAVPFLVRSGGRSASALLRHEVDQLLDGASVDTADKDPDERHVTVTGSAVQVIPLLPELAFTITATAGGPIECFRPDDGGEDCE